MYLGSNIVRCEASGPFCITRSPPMLEFYQPVDPLVGLRLQIGGLGNDVLQFILGYTLHPATFGL